MSDAELIARYVRENPQRPGVADARVVRYNVPVWALVGHWEAVHNSSERVADDYELPHEVVEAALAYYRQHKAIIDARLDANVA